MLPVPRWFSALAMLALFPCSGRSEEPKLIFAHYMGCYPVGTTVLSPAGMRKAEAALQPEAASYTDRTGGRWRDFPLVPADVELTPEQSADLEIRRAVRMGLDGFAVDVLAGQKVALASLDALFKVAEEKHYPIKITFCLDNPAQNPEAVRYLIEKHGSSPNLARRDGKPLLLGYRSHRWGQRLHPEAKKADWANPEAVRFQGEAVRELEKIAGQPLAVQFDLNGYMEDIPAERMTDPAFWKAAAAQFAKDYRGLSGFFWGGENYDTAARAARAAGLDWGEPVWFQYQSMSWHNLRLKEGLDLMLERWDRAIANDATLIQIATWNDYTESTHVAPAWQTGYAINDLMGLMIRRWKQGGWPKADRDRVYLAYVPYPKGSVVYPFHDFAPEVGGDLEVATYLTAPAKVVMPGRKVEWEAPAGFSVKKLPPAPGPVEARLVRGNKEVLAVKGREPITDRPFRPQHSLVAYSSEDARCWREDFPGKPEPTGYYADDDGDGLPNWFEMYYFGKLGDFSTATAAKPEDSPCHDGRTNREAYLERTSPLRPQTPPAAGTVWNLLQNPLNTKASLGVSTNPEADAEGRRVWRYVGANAAGAWTLLGDASLSMPVEIKPAVFNQMSHQQAMESMPPRKVISITHSMVSRNAFTKPDADAPKGNVVYRWTRNDEAEPQRTVGLGAAPGSPVGVEWVSPADGAYRVRLALDRASQSNQSAFKAALAGPDGKVLWSAPLDAASPKPETELRVTLKKGSVIRLQAEAVKAPYSPLPEITRFEIELEP